MDEDEDYVVNEHESDEEIADLEDAIEDEFVPDAAEPEDDVLSDYADENESVSAEEESSDEEDPKKRRKKKKKDHDDEWNLKSEEERNLKPYKMADKYTKARLQVDQLIQTELKLTQPLSPWHFASTDDYEQFLEDREMYVYNIANKHLENETLNTLKRRLAKLRGPVIPQYSEEQHLASSRKQIAVAMAALQYKIDKRVKPLMNAAQPSGQGSREVTLAAALLSRKQLLEASKWIEEEEKATDADIAARAIKPEVAKSGATFKFRPAPSSQAGGGFGPRPTTNFPPAVSASAAKDESSLATGYTRRIVEQRGIKELKSGLGVQ